MAPTTAEVICSALRHKLLCTDAGRARVTSDSAFDNLLDALVSARHELSELSTSHILPGALRESPGDGNMSEDSDDESDDIPTFHVAQNDPDWLGPPTACACAPVLLANPLYSLTTQEQLGDRTRGDHDRWVLVCGNYAGNDELEPAVRVRLVMPKETYLRLKVVLASGDWASLRAVRSGTKLCGYLFHFGYLVLPS